MQSSYGKLIHKVLESVISSKFTVAVVVICLVYNNGFLRIALIKRMES